MPRYKTGGAPNIYRRLMMTNLARTTLAIFAAAFLASAPAIAADATSAGAGSASSATATKPDLAGGLKQKAADVIEQGQKKADNAAQKLQDALGVKKQDNAASQGVKDADKAASTSAKKGKDEIVDVQQETVTVQTPDGTARESTTVITPEGQTKK